MKNKIIWRFLGAYISLITLAVFVLIFFASLKLRDYYELKIADQLMSNSILIKDILRDDLINNRKAVIQDSVDSIARRLKLRLTVIDESGRVLADSEENPGLMDNHSDRPEVQRAIELGIGESTRFSDTLGYNMKYVAIPIKDKKGVIGIVRLALPLIEVESQVRVIYRAVLLGGMVAILIVFIIGYFISKSITSPISEMKDIAQRIARGDFTKKVNLNGKDELAMLGKSLNRMADDLQFKMGNLKKMDKIKTDFVANVSHELKTPLTSIKGFIETLEDRAIDDKENAKKFIAIIKKHTERIINIVDDLLTLSELELGKDMIKKERFDLRELTKEVILGFGHAVSIKKQNLKVEYKGSDFIVNADKAKIEQVLVNLLDNAVKYTKEAGIIKVYISIGHDHAIIKVEDNGIGIPKEHLSRISERFYRVDKGRSRQLGGTGLGLAIVKHIVLLHNGNLDIKSEIDKGTAVTVLIPQSNRTPS